MKRRWILGLLCFGGVSPALADVKLNGLFASHMVVQRDAAVPVWGTADGGEKVTVAFAGQSVETTAGSDGTWRVELTPLSPGEPSELVVTGKKKIRLTDVAVGDVWLCSGQSNMAYPMDALSKTEYASDLTSANFPMIRHGNVQRNGQLDPVADVPVTWKVCAPDTVAGFSAYAFYIAREIQPKIGVPIGLLHASWGGTSAEAWTSLDAINTDAAFKTRVAAQRENLRTLPDRIAAFPGAISAWETKHGRRDETNAGEAQGFANLDADASSWTPAQLRAKWKDVGLKDGGIVWLRKEIDVAPEFAGKSFRLDWGSVEEMYETTYFNGEKLGSSGREAPAFYTRYVGYTVPATLVKPGKNVIAVRLVVNVGNGQAFKRQATGIGLRGLGITKIDDGVLLKIEKSFAPLNAAAIAERPECPAGALSGTGAGLFNGMINPLVGFPIKGAIWYQGEQDASRATAYRRMLPLLINGWRARWKSEFPFYIQQLPNWEAGGADLTQWAECREAQALTAKSLPHTFIACGIPLGESADVHPRNKRGIAARMAAVILADSYGQTDVALSPTFRDVTFESARAVVKFTTKGALATTDGQPPREFQLAGEDQKFYPAGAQIDGDSVVLTSLQVQKPVAVRYAYRNDPASVNLTDSTGAAAFPFRTDTWPTSTDKRP